MTFCLFVVYILKIDEIFLYSSKTSILFPAAQTVDHLKEDSPSWTDRTYVLNSEEIKHELSQITILINYLLLYHSYNPSRLIIKSSMYKKYTQKYMNH